MASNDALCQPLLSEEAPLLPEVSEQAPRLNQRSISKCVLAEGITDAAKRERYKQTQTKLLVALTIAFLFMLVEITGGIYAHSLAIITDAAHLLSDVSGFAISALAAYHASRKSHALHFSYGLHRIEVLGALASVLSVWLVTGVLLYEAVLRVLNPQPVDGKIMFIIAVVGVAVNILLVFILGGHSHSGHGHSHGDDGGGEEQEEGIIIAGEEDHHHAGGGGHTANSNGKRHIHHHHHSHLSEETIEHEVEFNSNHQTPSPHDTSNNSNINIRGAVIHVFGDLVQSLGVAFAGALIWYHSDDPRWALADPICTFLFAAVVLWTTLAILRDISDVLMEKAPRGRDLDEIFNDLMALEGVSNVHDLHIWSLTPGIPLLCAHVGVVSSGGAMEYSSSSAVLQRVTLYCRSIGIEHTTIQIVEEGGEGCCGGVQRCGVAMGDNDSPV